jgi:hypothetical protein
VKSDVQKVGCMKKERKEWAILASDEKVGRQLRCFQSLIRRL